MAPHRRARWIAVCAALALLLPAAGCQDQSALAQDARKEAPPDTRASLRVRVATVERAPLDRASEVSGVVSAFRSASVAAEVSGRVVERHVETGAVVEKGDALVSLDAMQLDVAVNEAQATLAAREVDLAEAKRELERAVELLEKGALSESRHESLGFGVERAESALAMAAASLRRARRSRADATIRAPFAGTVESLAVHVGDYLSPGQPVATVADFERVRLRAGVTAGDAAALSPGSHASVTITALGGLKLDADVHSIGRIADGTTGTYPVELWLDNQEGLLRGGMVARVTLDADAEETVLRVPRSALVRRGGQLAVFVVEGEPQALGATIRGVKVGRQGDETVELLEGVSPGERVVIEGQFALSDGAPVVVDEARAPGA